MARHLGKRQVSLASRLITVVVAVVVVLVVGFGGATYLALRSFEYRRLDQQLAGIANTSSAGFYFSPTFSYRGTRPADAGHVWATAFDSLGATVGPNPALASAMSISAADRTRLAARSGMGPAFLTLTNGERLRVQVVQAGSILSDEGVQQATLAIGLSTDEISRTLHRLLLLEILIGTAAACVALVGTSYGVRVSLRRLRDVTQTAQDVSAELSPDGAALNRRVEVSDRDVTEVGQLAGSLNTLLAAVESQFAHRVDSENRMRQFLLDASHELRTPLTSIRGYAELTRLHRAMGDGHSDSPEVVANLDRIEAEGLRMSRLVDDLLTLARGADGSAPQLQVLEMDELLQEATSNARAAFAHRTIETDALPGLTVLGDRDQLMRVLANLLTNAAVHTDPRGVIRVSGARGNEGSILIRVSDDGPGLPPEEAKHVFDRFWRADKARARVRGGSGLGMSIVASIVEAHGGTARFDSSIRDGSAVTVVLPPPSGGYPARPTAISM